MSRAVGPGLIALVVTGVLAAAVLAAPDDRRKQRADPSRGGGSLAVLRERPTELEPELDPYAPPPVKRPRPLEPIGDLAPERTGGPSRALGKPWAGRLRNGVQFPEGGASFFTFDSALRNSPSRPWRRFATAATVARTLSVLNDMRATNPDAPRLGVGDLSLPRGGPFGREYGGLGHASHQNGIDVDIYFARRDRAARPAARPSQVDRRLAQQLVDRLVAAGAEKVFVGPALRLRGPRGVVIPLRNHNDHAHARWPSR